MKTDCNTMGEQKKKRGNIANLKPCKPGETHNPHGRPRKDQSYNDVTREMLAAQKIDIALYLRDGSVKHIYLNSDKSLMHSVIAGQIKEAIGGDTAAANHLADRGYGKVEDKLKLETEKEIHITITEKRLDDSPATLALPTAPATPSP